jgi:hypothetical protein
MSPTKAIPATVRTSDLPASEPDLLKRLDAVLAASSRHRMPISEIHVPLARYPALATTFWHIPIVDSREPVFRVVYSAAAEREPATFRKGRSGPEEDHRASG